MPRLTGVNCIHIHFVSVMATATPSQHQDDVTLQPPATNPTQKHHLFWSVRPHQCSHVIFHMASSSGALVICSSRIRLAGFSQLIRWYLTHQFDQTVHRVCAASAVTSAPRCVPVFPLVPIALPHSRFHSSMHIHCYNCQDRIFVFFKQLSATQNQSVSFQFEEI